MATNALRSLWAEPRPTNPPDRGRPRDWALVAAFICWSAVEAVLREDMAPWPLLLIAALAAVAPLPWRRAHPLLAVAVGFGLLTLVDIVRILTASQGALPSSVSATLVLTYALFRWGSGREVAGGVGVILVWLAITHVADVTSLADTLATVSAQNIEKHRAWLDALKTVPEALPHAADIVVECAPSRLVRPIVAPVVARGKTAIVLSVGALLRTRT